jgi:hypothetical protein
MFLILFDGRPKKEDAMHDEKDNLAGWLAIVAAIALVPEVVLMYSYDAGSWASLPVLATASSIMAIRILCTAIALISLRGVLNRLYEFHKTDTVIPLLIAGSIVMWIVATAVRVPALALDPPVAAIALILVGVPLGIVSAVLGWRVLQVDSELAGYKKPFAWASILAPLCFFTVIAAPLGLLMMAAGSVFLGLILLHSREALPEFV